MSHIGGITFLQEFCFNKPVSVVLFLTSHSLRRNNTPLCPVCKSQHKVCIVHFIVSLIIHTVREVINKLQEVYLIFIERRDARKRRISSRSLTIFVESFLKKIPVLATFKFNILNKITFFTIFWHFIDKTKVFLACNWVYSQGLNDKQTVYFFLADLRTHLQQLSAVAGL